ncbi:signal recognition particle-docking protein FtsY [Spirochaetia bacterium]|nr:signal recognition particle-docking protein FtsY [Spirochaetia bacterium]
MGANNFADRLKNFFGLRKSISEELFEDLTDLLVEGDFGAAEAMNTVDLLREICRKEKITDPADLRQKLADLLESKLTAGNTVLPAEGLAVILLLGVNGVGKTTTAAKLVQLYRDRDHRKPILAAADTFRAAAIDQLKIHGDRLGVRVIAHQHGGDPAAVVYDAVEAAQSGAGDLIIADTAGRMHTKSALVEELKKIDRVVETKAAGAKYIKWLVLDATTGRNALVQAETFNAAVKVDGVILTKYDSGAKGGVVYSLMGELKLPVVYLCEGEKYGDIKVFDPLTFIKEFLSLA